MEKQGIINEGIRYQIEKHKIGGKMSDGCWSVVNNIIYNSWDDANVARYEFQRVDNEYYYRIVMHFDNPTIRIHDIVRQTMADGPGLRNSVYCAGCAHNCKGCHNPQTHDFNGGNPMDIADIATILCNDPYSDVTFTGGDPMYQVEKFTRLAQIIKSRTDKTIWLYTGFTYDQILKSDKLSMILPWIDVIVDGPYIESQRDTSLQFRGSSNQNIIYLDDSGSSKYNINCILNIG